MHLALFGSSTEIKLQEILDNLLKVSEKKGQVASAVRRQKMWSSVREKPRELQIGDVNMTQVEMFKYFF